MRGPMHSTRIPTGSKLTREGRTMGWRGREVGKSFVPRILPVEVLVPVLPECLCHLLLEVPLELVHECLDLRFALRY